SFAIASLAIAQLPWLKNMLLATTRNPQLPSAPTSSPLRPPLPSLDLLGTSVQLLQTILQF
ncbi:OLC1v1017331C1, partial [Oldenlandia corymbosa var. corymbosa]